LSPASISSSASPRSPGLSSSTSPNPKRDKLASLVRSMDVGKPEHDNKPIRASLSFEAPAITVTHESPPHSPSRSNSYTRGSIGGT
jgi:hypothetical protein